MERQFLVFLAEGDEPELLRRIDEVDPGLVVLPGKYVDTGDAGAILSEPGARRFRQAVRSQRRIYLAHRSHSQAIVLHPQPDGGFALDERRSELFELLLPAPRHGRLAPARLAATVVDFEGHEKLKRSAPFGRWVGRVLRALGTAYPPSSVDFVRVAPGALAFAACGGQLTYLEEPVLPTEGGRPGQVHKERIRE